MTTKKLIYSLAGVGILGLAGFFIYKALNSSLVYFVLPYEYAAKAQEYGSKRLRLGGVVEEGSVVFDEKTLMLAFNVTDDTVSYPVSHRGAPPDLFRENMGVVVEGHFKDGVFESNEVLIKHTEEYKPAEAGQPIDIDMLRDTLQ